MLGSFSFFLPADCISAGVASVEADYSAALAAIPNGTGGERVVSLSDMRLLQRSSPCVPPTASTSPPIDPTSPGRAQPPASTATRLGVHLAFAPHWGKVTPFVLKDSSQFRPGPAVLADQPQVRRGRQRGSSVSGAMASPLPAPAQPTRPRLPGCNWLAVAVEPPYAVGCDRQAPRPLGERRLYGLLNLALADEYIGTFETKYHYRFWRPVTAIRLAAIDGNPATTADPTWTTHWEPRAPPIPDYDSGHATEGGAAAQVLKRFFHTDKMSFSVCSFTLPAGQRCSDASPTLRHFTSFSQASTRTRFPASTWASTSAMRSTPG